MRQRRKEKTQQDNSSTTENDSTTSPLNTVSRSKGCCARLLCVFDCCWTCVLLLMVVIAIVALSPIGDFLYGTVHVYAYQINRFTRLSFLAVHPYLLYAGLDFTKFCLVQNPFADDDNKCPCINNPIPITISLNGTALPTDVYENLLNSFILRSAISIQHNDYGRDTLIQYQSAYGRLPSTCKVSGSSEGPIRLDQLTEDTSWRRWKELNTPWDFSW